MRSGKRLTGHDETPRTESRAMGEFASVLESAPFWPRCSPEWAVGGESPAIRGLADSGRLNLRHDRAKNELGRLVLTLVKLLHELLEKQAIERIEHGTLMAAEVERLGLTFMYQAREIDRLREAFGLEDEDLNIDLGPLGKLL